MIENREVRAFATFRFAALREGPDIALFTQPTTLARLARWMINAIRWQVAKETVRKLRAKRKRKNGGKDVIDTEQEDTEDEAERLIPQELPFVLACLDEGRGTYLVAGFVGSTSIADVRRKSAFLLPSHAYHDSISLLVVWIWPLQRPLSSHKQEPDGTGLMPRSLRS